MKLAFHPSHTPWKSLRGFPHSHGYGYQVTKDRQSPPKTRKQSHSHRKGPVNHIPGLMHKGCPGPLTLNSISDGHEAPQRTQRMKSNLLQMSAPNTAEDFSRTVPTVESAVNFGIRSIANEGGSCRICQIELPNQEGAAGRLCVALLLPEHVDELIEALNAWRALS